MLEVGRIKILFKRKLHIVINVLPSFGGVGGGHWSVFSEGVCSSLGRPFLLSRWAIAVVSSFRLPKVVAKGNLMKTTVIETNIAHLI